MWLLRPRPEGRVYADFEQRAGRAMLDHGLSGWAFGFGRGRRTLGSTRVSAGSSVGVIRVSRHLIAHGTPEQIDDTLLHEIAHAVAFRRHGRKAMNHGPLWRSVARDVGAVPRATCSTGLDLPAPYRLTCRRCGATIELFRRPKYAPDRYRHKGCGGRLRHEPAGDAD